MNSREQMVEVEAVKKDRKDGYIILRGLLDESELETLRKVFDGLESAHDRVVRTFADRLIQTRNLWQTNSDIKSLAWKLAPVAARLMGVGEVRLVDDVAFVKPPKQDGGGPTLWHQDTPNYPFDRRGFLTIWVAVDDIPANHGSLTYLPGSHRLGLLGAMDGAGAEYGLESLLQAEDHEYIGQPVTATFAAGDASVHDGATLHAAVRNEASRPRRAWALRFIPTATLYNGASHPFFDKLGLEPFEPFAHPDMPLIDCP
ncbi:MAG: phytanoyl-CoA dioxygenase family protein [Polynucleobacter sp.]|nr:phytanoyl-CoA dioxygenase family protein [Polynucleobacter sp.]